MAREHTRPSQWTSLEQRQEEGPRWLPCKQQRKEEGGKEEESEEEEGEEEEGKGEKDEGEEEEDKEEELHFFPEMKFSSSPLTFGIRFEEGTSSGTATGEQKMFLAHPA